jgi:hypothetical protein
MRCLAAIGTALLMAACGTPTFPLAHSFESPEALARAVLDALERKDVDLLNNLAVNEAEFREHVWPELPASRPERKLPFSYVWGDLHQKSDGALALTLVRHGGRRYEFLGLQFAGGTTPYQSYNVHRESEITVRDDRGGEQTIRLFGSVLEEGATFKVFSYVVDE